MLFAGMCFSDSHLSLLQGLHPYPISSTNYVEPFQLAIFRRWRKTGLVTSFSLLCLRGRQSIKAKLSNMDVFQLCQMNNRLTKNYINDFNVRFRTISSLSVDLLLPKASGFVFRIASIYQVTARSWYELTPVYRTL